MILPMLHPHAERVRAIELINRTLEQAHAAADYLSSQGKHGQRVPIDLSTSLVEYQEGKVILGIARDIRERQRVEEMARKANHELEQMRRYQAVETCREEERKHLEGELHDETLAEMADLAVDLALLERGIGDQPEFQARLGEVRQKIKNMARRLREIVQGIYPSVLTNLGLLPAISAYLKGLASHPIPSPFPLDVKVGAKAFGDQRLPEAVEIALYRTIQQAMSNVIAHASATRVEIDLSWDESEVGLTIADNGKGLNPESVEEAARTGHFGLGSLRYRTEGLGGKFEIHSEVGQGVTIRAMIPTASPGTGSREVKTNHVLLSAQQIAEVS